MEKESNVRLSDIKSRFIEYGEFTDADISYLETLSDEIAIPFIDDILGSNDELLERIDGAAIASQGNGTIYYEIMDLYRGKSTRNYRRRHLIHKNPPSLLFKDDLGNEVEMILTREVVESLIEDLEHVRFAYQGKLKINKKFNFIKWISDKIGGFFNE